MNRETIHVVVLAGLTALFLWSPWAGAAGVLAIALWIGWHYSRDLAARRDRQRRCNARISDALAAQGMTPGAVFHSAFEARALGVAGDRLFLVATEEQVESFPADVLLEARARQLKQGDFEIGFSAPGRVSGKPYWHVVLVKQRAEALRWVETVRPLLGDRLKPADLG